MIPAGAEQAIPTGSAIGSSRTSAAAAAMNGTTCANVYAVHTWPRLRIDSALARGRHGTADSSGSAGAAVVLVTPLGCEKPGGQGRRTEGLLWQVECPRTPPCDGLQPP